MALWAFWLEPASLRNQDLTLRLPRWSPACDGLKVAVLGDLHVGSPFNGLAKLRRVVELTDAAESDLVLLAGDYVVHDVIGGHFVEPEPIARVLAGLDAPLGIFGVLVVEQGRHLFVTSGVGTSILPVRFRVPPEVSVVELRVRE